MPVALVQNLVPEDTRKIIVGSYLKIRKMANYPSKASQEASIQTHKLWMDNPSGKKKCHFIDIVQDERAMQNKCFL
jgi:hypothetical protein